MRTNSGDWVNTKPRFATFHPGPFGGEFRSADKEVVARLRELLHMHRAHYVEVTSEEQLPALADRRDAIVADLGPQVKQGATTAGANRRFALEGVQLEKPVRSSRPETAAARVPATDEF